MRIHWMLISTFCFCLVAAIAATYLEFTWLRYAGSLAGNLPWFLVLDLTPIAVYAGSAILARGSIGLSRACCILSALAATSWGLAAHSAGAWGAQRDPDLEIGLLGFMVAIPHCIMTL